LRRCADGGGENRDRLAHRVACFPFCSRGIAPGDRVRNRATIVVRAKICGRPLFRLAPHRLRAFDETIEREPISEVLRSFDRAVPKTHLEPKEVRAYLCFSHFGRDRNELGSDRGWCPFGAETRDVGRDRGAHFQNGYPDRGHIPSARRVLRHQRQKIEARVTFEIEDFRAPALRNLDETDLLEPLQTFAHDVAVHTEHGGEQAFRRETRAGGVATDHDFAGELLENLIREGPTMNRA
jgi:hypothetical protein